MGEVIGDIDLSPDGRSVVAAVKRVESGWNLERFDVEQQQWTRLTYNQNLQSKPRFSNDGLSLYFVSDEAGRFDLRRMNLAESTVETLSSTLTAIVDFTVDEKNNRVRLNEYTANGLIITETVLKPHTDSVYNAIHKDQYRIGSFVNSADYNPDTFQETKAYSPWSSLRPRSWWAQFYSDGEDNTSLQFFVDGTDALGIHQWQLAPQLFIDKDALGGDASYFFHNRLGVLASRKVDVVKEANAGSGIDEIYDIEERLQWIYQQPFNSLEQSLRMQVGVAQETTERHSDLFDTYKFEDNLLGAMLNYDNSDYYLHSVSPEHGRKIKLIYEKYNALGDGFYSGGVATLDWREFFSFNDNHVLSLRWVRGHADEESKPFELGGRVDGFDSLAGRIGFGKTDYTLRGYDGEFVGSELSLLSTAWTMPLEDVFDGFFIPPVGLGKTAIRFFVDTGSAWRSGESARYYNGVGFEFRPRLLIGYDNLGIDVRLGVARGLDSEFGKTDVYLDIQSFFD